MSDICLESSISRENPFTGLVDQVERACLQLDAECLPQMLNGCRLK
jgi:hypothetical protein